MKIVKSFVFAFNGIVFCFQKETNFKIHLFFAAVVVLMGINFHISTTEWLAIAVCTGFVLAMELLNTAVEKLCDVVHPAIHPQIKKVKDISAGAVLLTAVASAVAGTVIFLPKIIVFVKHL